MNTASQNSTLNSNSEARNKHRALVLPNVPDAIYDEDHQGLLLIDKLTNPLRVEFEVWPYILPGDTYELLWNGSRIDVIKTIGAEQQGDPIFLEVPVGYLVEGVHSVAYRVTNGDNGLFADSASVPVVIDLTPPGLPKLAPMKFPEVVDCGLTSAELASQGDLLIAEIGSYAGIYQHDVIRTFWGDIEGPGVIVSSTDTGLNRIRIVYTKAFLLSLGDFDGHVTYTVKDRAGNISEPSLGTRIRLLFDDVPECFKDRVTKHNTHSVRHSDNAVNITVRLQSSASTSDK